MAKDNGYNSIPEIPIRFFLKYPKGGRDHLYKEYVKLNERDRYFDKKRNKAFELVTKQIDEDVTETSEVEFPFEDFISHQFEDEILESIDLITEYYNNPSSSDIEFEYNKLLRDFIENFENFKNFESYPESELLPSALIFIVKRILHLYRRLFPKNSLARQAKQIIEKEEKLSGQTGYNLKIGYKGRISEFNRKLIANSLVAKDTEYQQWLKFFNGKFVFPNISWTGEYKELWYFIISIATPDFIDKPPYHKFKHLPKIFKFKGITLDPDFYRNHNYLNKADQIKINKILNSLKG